MKEDIKIALFFVCILVSTMAWVIYMQHIELRLANQIIKVSAQINDNCITAVHNLENK